jgi:predicted metal-dependent enzyme (double-stranded beta helix superfamily)
VKTLAIDGGNDDHSRNFLGSANMFDIQRFIEQCKGALHDTNASGAIREIVERAVSNPAEVLAGLGEPKRATVQRLHVADDLTIINVIWGPHMTIMPHNHKMTAIIGV